jgi:hypothetical protein
MNVPSKALRKLLLMRPPDLSRQHGGGQAGAAQLFGRWCAATLPLAWIQ